MKKSFSPNIQTKGRIARGLVAALLLTASIFAFESSPILGLVLLVPGLFILFEALRGWCALRACGIKTKL